MNKRAEEAALKAYPDDMGTLKEVKYISRLAYRKGYEKAEKDTVERAAEWWRESMTRFIGGGLAERVLQDFKKAMEEE